MWCMTTHGKCNIPSKTCPEVFCSLLLIVAHSCKGNNEQKTSSVFLLIVALAAMSNNEQHLSFFAHCCSLLLIAARATMSKNLGARNQISRKSQLISKLFHNQLQTSGHVLEGMLHLPWVVIHHMKPDQVDYWQLQGFQDWCIYTRFRIGFTFDTNPE